VSYDATLLGEATTNEWRRAMAELRNPWADVRCLFECPIMDERKWAKIPSIPADAFILDMEDALPETLKVEGRAKVVEFMGSPDYFGGALTVPRPNPLDTPWGRDDLEAVVKAGATTVMLAKVDSRDDVDQVADLCAEFGGSPNLLVSIESARGVLRVEEIFSHPAVVAATFGPGDLHAQVGMSLYEPDGSMNIGLVYPKIKTILAGVAEKVPVLGIAFGPNVKDLDDIEARLEAEKRLGFTGCSAFYPPHVELINKIFAPSPEEVSEAEEIVALFDSAAEAGKPAVQLASGKVVLKHQYREARAVLARVR
jgi:citrate lyase beta subunit